MKHIVESSDGNGITDLGVSGLVLPAFTLLQFCFHCIADEVRPLLAIIQGGVDAR